MKDPQKRTPRVWFTGLFLAAVCLFATQFASAQITDTYTNSGTFTVPAGVSQVTVECWGGGGRGGNRTSNGRGGGGGGGAYARSTIAVVEGNTYTVTVGDGSTGTGDGGDSWFSTSTTLRAKGGASCGNNSSTGANGGSAASSIGSVKFAGGNGANAPGSTGAGGGSSAGTAAGGANGSGQNGGNAPAGGGDGGDGGNAGFFVGAGSTGTSPGGGGGGAEKAGWSGNQNGGNGADGRVMLTYTPCAGPSVAVSPSSSSICTGESVVLTASGASAGYTWSPGTGLSSTSGSVVTANPTTTTTYTLTGLNTGCTISGSTEVTVVVKAGPTAVSATSSSSTICAGSTVNLTGGAVNVPSTILSNDFNSGIGSWSTENNSTGGTPANAEWTLRPDGYNVSSNTFHSNDNSQFYMTNSDPQGSGGSTETILSTPMFSTVGYTTLSVAYHHFYREYSGDDRARVEVSTNGTTWTTVQTHSSTTGSAGSFASGSVNLNAYTGQAIFYVRFRYTATYDWWWAIDNVVISGTPTALTWAWTSTPSGYSSSVQSPTNAAVPSDRTFNLTATAGNGCTATANTGLVTAVPLPNAGTNGTLTICSSAAPASLLAQLTGTPDGGGAWSGPSPVIGDMYDPVTMDTGVYTYLVSAPPCAAASATVTVTENTATPWYADDDGDGFGDPGDMIMACGAPAGYIADNSDCDDSQTTYIDVDGDGFGTGSPLPCGVADNTDCDDTQVLYADTDGDGYGAGTPAACGVPNNLDDCPAVVGLIGSNCDAQAGPGFVLGQLDGTCSCVAIPCTENVVLELRTDMNSEEAGWEILDQNTNLVICSGGAPDSPFPHGITNPITQSCCLPIGCYRLRVSDAGGDGFVTGGYQLRESGTNGRRIIDNLGNFTSGSMSSTPSNFDNGAFCVPMSDDGLIFSSADKMDWVNYKYLVAHANPAVSAQWQVGNQTDDGYEFWIFDPNGTYSFRKFRSHAHSDGFSPASANRACHMKINNWYNSPSTPLIPSNVLLNVRVRARVNGVNGAFGPTATMKIDPVRAACPLVKLQDDPAFASDYSCGVTRTVGGPNSNANKLVALPPKFSPAPFGGGTGVVYQFRFRIPAENVCIVRPAQASPTIYLNWTNGPQLQCSKTYEVEVRVSKDMGATWCVDSSTPACDPSPVTAWGKSCLVSITNCVQGGSGSSMVAQGNGNVTMYPNPNHGDQLFISLTNVTANVNTVSVDIFDLTGKPVSMRTIAVQDGFANKALDLDNSLNSGMYMVHITVGEKTFTERLVIQK